MFSIFENVWFAELSILDGVSLDADFSILMIFQKTYG